MMALLPALPGSLNFLAVSSVLISRAAVQLKRPTHPTAGIPYASHRLGNHCRDPFAIRGPLVLATDRQQAGVSQNAPAARTICTGNRSRLSSAMAAGPRIRSFIFHL